MDKFNSRLINWFNLQKRILPWRNTSDPYKIWVSEIMLQQTQVITVIDYYNRFIELMPSVKDLAEIDLDILLKVWEGLGYYSRARNLQKTAKIIVNDFDSVFPKAYDELLALPGIGPYTAGAIMSIAYNMPYSAIDGNVYRVIARHNGIKKSIKDPSIKKEIKKFVDDNLSVDNSRFYTESLMELGAVVCTPSKPNCAICPINASCVSYKLDMTDKIPVKQKRPKKKQQDITIVVLVHNGKIGLTKRKQDLLKNLYTYDTHESKLTSTDIQKLYSKFDVKTVIYLESYKHVFTHLVWNIDTFIIETKHPVVDFIYTDIEVIEKVYSLPKAYKKLIKPIKKFIT